MFHKIDDFIINGVQTVYLWVLDRTGVYVGSLMVANSGIAFVAGYRADASVAFKIVWAIVTLSFLLQACARWFMQHHLSHNVYNAGALVAREMPLRLYGVCFIFGTLAIDLLLLDLRSIVINCACLLHIQSMCILIRDREPKEWLSFAKPVPQGI